jgi:hypothetical protein
MAPAGIANSAASNQLAAMTLGQHKRSGHGAPSLSDVDSAGATAAKAKSPSGKIGSLLDMKA